MSLTKGLWVLDSFSGEGSAWEAAGRDLAVVTRLNRSCCPGASIPWGRQGLPKTREFSGILEMIRSPGISISRRVNREFWAGGRVGQGIVVLSREIYKDMKGVREPTVSKSGKRTFFWIFVILQATKYKHISCKNVNFTLSLIE